ncbi:MAG TPA: hypothetical protein VF172_11090, partial [Nitrososphaera sp.]
LYKTSRLRSWGGITPLNVPFVGTPFTNFIRVSCQFLPLSIEYDSVPLAKPPKTSSTLTVMVTGMPVTGLIGLVATGSISIEYSVEE